MGAAYFGRDTEKARLFTTNPALTSWNCNWALNYVDFKNSIVWSMDIDGYQTLAMAIAVFPSKASFFRFLEFGMRKGCINISLHRRISKGPKRADGISRDFVEPLGFVEVTSMWTNKRMLNKNIGKSCNKTKNS